MPTCHPGAPYCALGLCKLCYERRRRAAARPETARTRTPDQRERRNAADRERRARRRGAGERFPVGPLLAYAAGAGCPPIDMAELNARIGFSLSGAMLTDREADHAAVALGTHPGCVWPAWWTLHEPDDDAPGVIN